jgi:hypothetical protein
MQIKPYTPDTPGIKDLHETAPNERLAEVARLEARKDPLRLNTFSKAQGWWSGRAFSRVVRLWITDGAVGVTRKNAVAPN